MTSLAFRRGTQAVRGRCEEKNLGFSVLLYKDFGKDFFGGGVSHFRGQVAALTSSQKNDSILFKRTISQITNYNVPSLKTITTATL